MSKKFPQIKVNELIKVLLKLGYREKRQSGSHRIFRHELSKKMIVIPDHHQDLKKGLIFAILRQLDLSKEEFLDLK